MRVLVCGSRDFSDRKLMEDRLGQLGIQSTRISADRILIIHGGARGADRMAGELAGRMGFGCRVLMAQWTVHDGVCACSRAAPTCKRAGYRRNVKMLNDGQPDLVLAFYAGKESPGTRMMVKLAKDAGVPVEIFGL